MAALLPLLPLLLLGLRLPPAAPRDPELLVLTVATEVTEGYERFLRSAQRFNYSVRTLGLGQPWRGGDVAHTVGGGQKVRWLREAMGALRGDPRLLLLVVDSYDVIFAGGPRELVAKFLAGGANVVFSAEGYCWPQEGLAGSYPPPQGGGKRFLNSGGFLGFAPSIWRLVQGWNRRDDEDDQLFYTQLYLQPPLREGLGLALDHRSHIFQNLNGALDEVTLKFEPGGVRVKNEAHGTLPVIIHGNGPTKLQLNYLGNYVPDGWSQEGDCGHCQERLRDLSGVPAEQLPLVQVGVFVQRPTPFLQPFLRRLLRWSYPPARLRLLLHNSEWQHQAELEALLPQLRRRFSSVRLLGPQQGLQEGPARDLGMSLCREDPECSHYLSIDSDVVLRHPGALRSLLSQNRRVLAPLLSRPGQLWSNFWGALSPDGYYARSQDYVDIVQGRRRGVWNVPHISHLYLVSGAALRGPLAPGPVFTQPGSDPDMAFPRLARERGLFLHLTNRESFGHLLVTGHYNSSRLHPDLLQLPHNPLDWEEQYVHENYSRVLQDNLFQEPCPDVFQFPLVSAQFCRELLEEALQGHWEPLGYQAGAEWLPLATLGLEGPWLGALRRLLPAITSRLFPGYRCKGRPVLSGVVRYLPSPTGLPDPPPARGPPSATLSLSVTLSPPQGGGWQFPRYSCSAPPPPPGWVLLHPGRLTHLPLPLPPPQRPQLTLLTLLDP